MRFAQVDFANFDAVIFDMDGTLVDNMPYHRQTWVEWAHREGVTLADAEILAQTHGTITEIVARFFPEKSSQELFQIGERKEALYREIYAPHLREIEGLRALLDNLQNRHLPIALATAGDQTNIKFTVDGLGLRPYFAALVGGEDVSNGKPNPEVFLLAAQKLGVAPEKCLVFEDSPEGTEAARRAGMKAVVVNKSKPREEFGETSHVLVWIDDYRDL